MEVNNPGNTQKAYAEKIIMCDGQVSQCIFTGIKWRILSTAEETILFSLYTMRIERQGQLADTDVKIFEDGRYYTVPAGSRLMLHPGESLTLYPYYYHEFIIPKNGKG